MGHLVRTLYPDSAKEESTYDAEGRRLKSKDRSGHTTTFEYDKVGRLRKTYYNDGSSTETKYDLAGRVYQTIDALGHVTAYGYDDAGRRTSVTDNLNHVTTFGYDTNGNQTSMKDAKNHTVTNEYDKNNRQTKVTYPDATYTSTDYDVLGRVTAKFDQAGKKTSYTYDAIGRLTKVTDALNQVTEYAYDELGNQLSQKDALGRVTTYEYDQMGRRMKRTLPLGMFETYAYNNGGNLTSRTDFNGKVTTYSYDSMNRLLAKTPDPSFSQSAITFTYNSTGQRATMTDSSGVTGYGYDGRNRLVSKTTPQGTLSYTYDNAGNLLSLRSSNQNGVAVDYDYDELNRLKTATGLVSGARPGTGTTSYSYDEVGNLSGYVYPNGVTTAYTYNTLNRLTDMVISKTASIASYVYELGPAGNRTSVTEKNGRKAAYTYDDLYRLTKETITGDPVSSGNGEISYAYDAVGNRLSRTSTITAIPSTTQTYDSNDRLGTDQYDSNGSTTGSDGKTYRYDFENRLIAVNEGTPNEIRIVYDGDGNRVAKTVGGVTTKYLVDDNNLTGYSQVVEEMTSISGQPSAVTRIYNYGLDLISQTQVIDSAWTTSYYGYDGHGSVRFLTDASGAITDTYTYDAFGNMISLTGTTPNNYLYCGEQFDPDLGFYFLRARYMNPSTGRFWTVDPFNGLWSDPISLHKYLYSRGNPVNWEDPSGMMSIGETMIVCAIVGILAGILINGLYNYTNKRPFFEGAKNAAIVGGIAGVLCYLVPLVGVVGAAYGLCVTSVNALYVLQDPDATAGQKFVAIFLVVLAAVGLQRSASYASKNGWGYNQKVFGQGGQSLSNQNNHPPGWDENWEWRYPEGGARNTSPRWFDETGGEWRWHAPDQWHPEGHWDYNPWTDWNSPWTNVPQNPPGPQ